MDWLSGLHHTKSKNPSNPFIRFIRDADEWAAFVGFFHHRNNKPDLLVGDNTNKGKRV